MTTTLVELSGIIKEFGTTGRLMRSVWRSSPDALSVCSVPTVPARRRA